MKINTMMPISNLVAVVPVVVAIILVPRSAAESPPTKNTCKSIAGVETTCRAAARASPSVDYDFCVASLKSARDAASADLQGLAAAAVTLAVANAESAEAKVDDLMDLEPDPTAKEKYSICVDTYDDVGDRLRDALDAVNARLYAKATRLLRSAPEAYLRCNEVFEGAAGVRSPMVGLDRDYRKLVAIGMAILSMVD